MFGFLVANGTRDGKQIINAMTIHQTQLRLPKIEFEWPIMDAPLSGWRYYDTKASLGPPLL